MAKNLKHETYNDGILEYGEIKSIFNASRKKIGEDFTSKGKLFYTQMSARDSDILQASNMGYMIDLKLKTPYRPDITSKHKIKIRGDIYDIQKLDSTNQYLYLYLQKVGV